MKRMIKIELKKAFHARMFLISMAVAIVIAMLAVVYNVERYQQIQTWNEQSEEITNMERNPDIPAFMLFVGWLCTDATSLTTAMFWFLVPILAPLAYGWSLFIEEKSGYPKNVITRTTRKNYYLAKLLAVFLAGGTAVTLPVILNFMVTALFIPAVRPDVWFDANYAIFTQSMLSGLFYSKPFLYVLLRILITFLFSGALATASYSLTFAVRNRFAVLLLPFLLILGVNQVENMIPKHYAEYSPIYLLGANGHYISRLEVVLLEMGILLLTAFLLAWFRGGRKDVF